MKFLIPLLVVMVCSISLSYLILYSGQPVRESSWLVRLVRKYEKPIRKYYTTAVVLTIAGGLGLLLPLYLSTLPVNGKAEAYVDSYIRNSTTVTLSYLTPDELREIEERNRTENTTPERIERDFKLIEKYHSSRIINTGIKIYGNRGKMKHVTFITTIFKDGKSQKYYALMYAERSISQQYMFSAYLNDGTTVAAQVNNDELCNPNYGTVENPIPVLTCRLPECEERQDYAEAKITETKYRSSVYYYLAYLMPKKEFKERFGNKKK